MGHALAARGMTLVFGGGGTGLMGELANAAMEGGAQVIGVIPEMFDTPILAHPGLSEMRVVKDMHTRKAHMIDVADAFIALPGGFGTFEELFEVLTWAQIGLHNKPVGVLNTRGYFDPLMHLVEHAGNEGFIYAQHRQLLLCDSEPDTLLDRLMKFRSPEGLEAWVNREEAS
jgi:uncharacterized protein (TIGR00730 family)